jgi:hypothetical protein
MIYKVRNKNKGVAHDIKRLIQFLTGFNKIHHIHYSYGYKLPFIQYAYFGKRHGAKSISVEHYHNCTITGIY